MRPIVKLLSLAVLTAWVVLSAANPALAQTGDYINSTTSVQGDSGAAPDGGTKANTYTSGAWGTVVGDTVKTITVYYSTDGKNWTAVAVSAISGKGGTGGGFAVGYYLSPRTTYWIYASMVTQNGAVVNQTPYQFTHP